MTQREFAYLLLLHDWYYQHSDDPDIYRYGRESWRRITKALKTNPEYQPLFDAAKAYGWYPSKQTALQWAVHLVAIWELPYPVTKYVTSDGWLRIEIKTQIREKHEASTMERGSS